MVTTEVRAVTWAQARAVVPAKINLVCDQQNSVFEDTVKDVLTRLLADEEAIDDTAIVAKWPDRDDPTLHIGTLVAVDDDHAVFDDGIGVPLTAIVAVSV